MRSPSSATLVMYCLVLYLGERLPASSVCSIADFRFELLGHYLLATKFFCSAKWRLNISAEELRQATSGDDNPRHDEENCMEKTWLANVRLIAVIVERVAGACTHALVWPIPVRAVYQCAQKCYNREFEACCLEKRVEIGLPCNYSALLEHPAQERSSSALLAGQNNDRSTIDYFLCLTRGEDNTQCCRDAGVGDDCLDLCKPMDQNPDIGRCANPSEAFKAFDALASCSSNVQFPFGQ
ncbi:DB module domain-containing protein [Ditylenchus destructor]|uniref:DB module domain-containing protein n=1 Tax=Ditylenchus destructor TaxID=166010 RepID=A0AAD4MP48_9BILA|nr:DB module domain-containing protein [Ditylenchus destructor]